MLMLPSSTEGVHCMKPTMQTPENVDSKIDSVEK
jgi:hypothetical protein